jgi:hypothetical protein
MYLLSSGLGDKSAFDESASAAIVSLQRLAEEEMERCHSMSLDRSHAHFFFSSR